MNAPKIFGIFTRSKPALILVEILNNRTGECYASGLAKKTDCTYSHVVKLLNEYTKAGLLTRKQYGRTKTIILTKKGTEVAMGLNNILGILR